MGVPTDEAMSAAWDKQKMTREQRGDSIIDNLLDAYTLWPVPWSKRAEAKGA
jgi:hypothetical protein